MPKNEDGEFELVLGNTQLLSVFFIVVALMGVFFAIGYILGRNSSPMATEAAATVHKSTKPPTVVDSASDSNPASTQAPAPVEKAAPVDQPAPEKPKPEPAKAAKPEPAKSEPRNEPAKQAAAKPEPKKSAPAQGGALSGTYLQLSATNEHEASVYIDVLRKKGFRAQTAPVPGKPGLFRVLVGPIADGALNKTRSDLQASGFPGNQAYKQTY